MGTAWKCPPPCSGQARHTCTHPRRHTPRGSARCRLLARPRAPAAAPASPRRSDGPARAALVCTGPRDGCVSRSPLLALGDPGQPGEGGAVQLGQWRRHFGERGLRGPGIHYANGGRGNRVPALPWKRRSSCLGVAALCPFPTPHGHKIPDRRPQWKVSFPSF